MYRDSDQVYTRKINHAGIISQTRNYIMYEDVDKTDKYRKKNPIIQEPRSEPFNDPLDNYRYYEDLTLRDKRNRSLVKHERTSGPVGRETPFERDSFKRTIINYVPASSTLKSHSYERSNPRPEPSLQLRQGRPMPEFRPGSRKGSRQELKHDPRLLTIQGSRLGPGPRQEEMQGSRPRPEPYLNKQYSHRNYISFLSHQSPICNRCPSCGRELRPEGSNRGNHTFLRQLYVGPQRTYNFRANNTQLEERKKKFYDCYQSDDNEDESDYNYKYKQITCIRHPQRNDSKTFHRRRKKSGGSSYEKLYRKRPRFDGGFSNLSVSSSYYRINGYK